ncbi:oligosaccharide flippase family protein [Teredinibacter franksiae]|uniref:oligosaccharide flippase family protein n=1 Tax=Teredinibacter franksiae TaxID=2761453 RepID=UPI00162A89C3|nr:oligosaccharide flippase family protein [Teredinibacter franksiae]
MFDRLFSKSLFFLFLSKMNLLVVPLIVYPICISTVGLEKFGFIVFWVGVSAFAAKIMSLNMDSYSSRQVFLSQGSPESLRLSILMPVYMKLCLCCVVFPFFVVACAFRSQTHIEFVASMFCAYPMLGVVFTLNHFVVGLGKFDVVLFASVSEKLIVLIGVLFFLSSEKDYWKIPLIYTVATICSILVYTFSVKVSSYVISRSTFKVKSREYFKVARWLLLGKLMQLHTNGAKVLIGLIFGYAAVTIYDVAEKIVNLLKMPMTLLGDLFFSNDDDSRRFYRDLFIFQLALSVFIWLGVFLFGEFALRYFSGEHYSERMLVTLKVLSLILFSMPFLIVFGSNYTVKHCDKATYGKLLVLSNSISLCFLAIWGVFFYTSFSLFLYWVVSCELIFGLLCLYQYYSKMGVEARSDV